MSQSRRSYTDATLKLLFARCAGRCAYPCCDVRYEVIEGQYHLYGEIAHIIASSDSGPRGDPNYPASLRDACENLIVLCPNHHSLVDSSAGTIRYTIRRLRTWKRRIEWRVSLGLNNSFLLLFVLVGAILWELIRSVYEWMRRWFSALGRTAVVQNAPLRSPQAPPTESKGPRSTKSRATTALAVGVLLGVLLYAFARSLAARGERNELGFDQTRETGVEPPAPQPALVRSADLPGIVRAAKSSAELADVIREANHLAARMSVTLPMATRSSRCSFGARLGACPETSSRRAFRLGEIMGARALDRCFWFSEPGYTEEPFAADDPIWNQPLAVQMTGVIDYYGREHESALAVAFLAGLASIELGSLGVVGDRLFRHVKGYRPWWEAPPPSNAFEAVHGCVLATDPLFAVADNLLRKGSKGPLLYGCDHQCLVSFWEQGLEQLQAFPASESGVDIRAASMFEEARSRLGGGQLALRHYYNKPAGRRPEPDHGGTCR